LAQLKTDQFAAYDDVWKSIGNKAYTDDYALSSDNPFSSMDSAMALAEGIRLFNEGDCAPPPPGPMHFHFHAPPSFPSGIGPLLCLAAHAVGQRARTTGNTAALAVQQPAGP
jgi:hypothetical protein